MKKKQIMFRLLLTALLILQPLFGLVPAYSQELTTVTQESNIKEDVLTSNSKKNDFPTRASNDTKKTDLFKLPNQPILRKNVLEETSPAKETENLPPVPVPKIITGTWGTAPISFDTSTGELTVGAGILNQPLGTSLDTLGIPLKSVITVVLSQPVSISKSVPYLFSRPLGESNENLDFPANLKEIRNLANLSTTLATDMSYMFYGASSLTSLDLSKFDTSNVTNMTYMFFDCAQLAQVEFYSFNTSKVTDMSTMFYNCASLTTLNLASFDTSAVKFMNNMFDSCSNLEKLNISKFNTTTVTHMEDMFFYTVSLRQLTLGAQTSLTDTCGLETPLELDPELYSGNWVNVGIGTLLAPEKTVRGDAAAVILASQQGVVDTYIWETGKYWGDVPWDFDKIKGTLTFTSGGTLAEASSSPWNRDDSAKIDAVAIKKIVFTTHVQAPKNAQLLFSSSTTPLTSLNDIEGLNKVDVSHVTDMTRMFAGNTALELLDLGTWDTTKNPIMDDMFKDIPQLKYLLLSLKTVLSETSMLPNPIVSTTYSGNWVNIGTGSLEDPEKKIRGDAQAVIKASKRGVSDVYLWETYSLWGNVPWKFDETTGILTFVSGGTLGEHTLSPWNRKDRSKVDPHQIKEIVFMSPVTAPVNSSYLFSAYEPNNRLDQLKNIKGLDLLDVSPTDNMSSMFEGATALQTLEISNWNTSKVTNMSKMFKQNTNLSKLDISKWQTSTVTNMSEMFSSATALTELDLSGWNMQQVLTKRGMLANTQNLARLTLNAQFRSPNNDVSLPLITQADYSGRWVNEADPTIVLESSDLFMANYDGTHPGTYVWQKAIFTLNTVPKSFNFGDMEKLKPGKQLYPLKKSSGIETDYQLEIQNNINSNWKLNIQGDALTNDIGDTMFCFLQFKMRITGSGDENALSFGDIVQDEIVTVPMDGSAAATLLESRNHQGLGTWITQIDPESINLLISDHQVKQNTRYTGQIHWTLEDVLP